MLLRVLLLGVILHQWNYLRAQHAALDDLPPSDVSTYKRYIRVETLLYLILFSFTLYSILISLPFTTSPPPTPPSPLTQQIKAFRESALAAYLQRPKDI